MYMLATENKQDLGILTQNLCKLFKKCLWYNLDLQLVRLLLAPDGVDIRQLYTYLPMCGNSKVAGS